MERKIYLGNRRKLQIVIKVGMEKLFENWVKDVLLL